MANRFEDGMVFDGAQSRDAAFAGILRARRQRLVSAAEAELAYSLLVDHLEPIQLEDCLQFDDLLAGVNVLLQELAPTAAKHLLPTQQFHRWRLSPQDEAWVAGWPRIVGALQRLGQAEVERHDLHQDPEPHAHWPRPRG